MYTYIYIYIYVCVCTSMCTCAKHRKTTEPYNTAKLNEIRQLPKGPEEGVRLLRKFKRRSSKFRV